MKTALSVSLLFTAGVLFLSGCAAPASAEPSPLPEPTPTQGSGIPAADLPEVVGKLHWFGVSSILYHGSKNIYFDPVSVDGAVPPADIILISHGHVDHMEMASLKKIVASETILIVGPNATGLYESNKEEIGIEAVVLAEGESTEAAGVAIRAVPAFDTRYHVRGTGGVGFLVTVDGQTIYFAGGTNFFPEMADIESDVTLYPWYTNADVLQAAGALQTRVLIPVHASGSGAKAFADVYAKEVTRLAIVALPQGPYNP